VATTATDIADGRSLQGSGRGRYADPAFRVLMIASGAMVLVILALMIGSTTVKSWPIFRHEGLGFFTGTKWAAGAGTADHIQGTYGAWPFIYGTLVTSLIAVVIAVPLAVGIALYLTQMARGRLGRLLTYAVDLLAAVPSVVYGLWGIYYFVPTAVKPVERWLSDHAGFIPLFKGPVYGFNFFAAGIVLAIMILPIISALVREVVNVVPADEQLGAYGLGATRWEVIRHVVLPRSRSGIIGATMLGLGRALGETIAVALLVGGSATVSGSLFHAGYSMAALIALTFGEASDEGLRALLAMGVALFVITIIVNMAARLMVWRLEDPEHAAA
jgi:phosphate transport system permease protein